MPPYRPRKSGRTSYTKTNIHNQHKGYKGWNRIKNGQLTLSGFRRFGGRHFDQLAKRKIVYFYSLPHLLMSGTAMVQYVPIPSSRLACKLIIFDQYDNSWVHLGLERESSVDAYYPRSFFIERISTASPDSRFVHGQPLVYSVTWKRRYNRYPVIRPYKKKTSETSLADCLCIALYSLHKNKNRRSVGAWLRRSFF